MKPAGPHMRVLFLVSLMTTAALLASGIARVAVAASATPSARGHQASLEGSWSGSGRVVLPSGSTEKASCQALFRRQGANAFHMSARCATSSTRIAQTAGLVRIGANRFSGHFYNAEYAISGTINVTLHGDRLSASLTGGGGSAFFQLSK
jgi:hypothetical protein